MKRIFFLCCGLLSNSLAEAVELSIPTNIQPGRVQQSLQPQFNSQPQSRAPAALPELEPSKKLLQDQKAKEIYFVLNKIVLENARVFSEKQLLPLYQDKLHKKISVADLEKITEAITNFCRQKGYLLSRAVIPPQEIRQGVVKIQIIEGYFGSLVITGNPGRAKTIIQKMGLRITEIKPMQLDPLVNNLLLMNNLPGVSVKSIITPSRTKPEAADLILDSQLKRTFFSVTYNNYGTRYIGPQQLLLTAAINSAFFAGDTTALNIARAGISGAQLSSYTLSNDTPIGLNGIRLTTIGSYTETLPGFLLEGLDLSGRAKSLSTSVTFPLLMAMQRNINLQIGLNYMDSTTNFLGAPLNNDRIRNIKTTLNYGGTSILNGFDTLRFSLTKGVDAFGASPANDPQLTRLYAPPSYTKFMLRVSRLQPLGRRLSFYAQASGQYTRSSMLALEQFGFGGSDIGRGYDPSEITGDKGESMSLELRTDFYPGKQLLQSVQPYVFYDVGKVWSLPTPQVGQLATSASAASAGFGVRPTFSRYLNGNLYFAKPLTRPVATQVGSGKNGNIFRIFFQISAMM